MQYPKYVVLDKKVGETPLQVMEMWKQSYPEFSSLPMTYAGRLDPMASGKLLVLLGDECKQKDKYTGLDKEYEIEVVLDLSTDTGDALGLAEKSSVTTTPPQSAVRTALHKLTGTHQVPYPAFSSKTVNGTPLFEYALRGTLDTISLPEHDETIHAMHMIQIQEYSAKELLACIRKRLSVVPRSDKASKVLGADFRQDQIRGQWDELLSHGDDRTYTVIQLRVTCASGTYMRTLASRLGKELGTTGFTLSIHRSKIGKFVNLGWLRFWRMAC
jgi:tRNA pseudouridine(55) synthase